MILPVAAKNTSPKNPKINKEIAFPSFPSFHFEEDNKEKRIIIQDNGIGIKLEDIHRVFEKGFTGSTGRSHAKSTGMGLYLARQLANKLGHDITIKSQEEKYTKVIIHFPKIRNYYHLN